MATVAAMVAAAMEVDRGAGMNVSTSSTGIMRSMTAMANVLPKLSNVTNSVPQLQMAPLPLSVAKMMKQHADLSQIILLSELVKRLGDASITSSPVVPNAEMATSDVEMCVARSLSSDCAKTSVLQIISSVMESVLQEEMPVE